MKKKAIWLLPAALALTASVVAATTVTVLVEQTALRKRPQFYAPVAATAKLGDAFEATGPDAGWYKTDAGYLHQSAVTAKKVKLDSSGSVGGSASAEEITLAGKGFNPQVEESYSGKHPEANFAAVDKMGRRRVSDDAVIGFMKAGALLPGGGQ